MIAALWHRLTAPFRPRQRVTPFVREMRTYRADAVTQTRESLRAQRRDRARRDNPIERVVLPDRDDGRPPCAD